MSPKSTVHGGVTDAAQEQAWREGRPYEGPACDPGGTGAFVRTLVELAASYAA